MFHFMDHREPRDILHSSGFSKSEIERLIKFRKHFQPTGMDQTSAEYRRLDFVRWLFKTGKLSDNMY